jgi:hypothetical protein
MKAVDANRRIETSRHSQNFNVSSHLELAGFRLRGRRAECIHCQGRSRWTVSFTPEVAFCHRCHWTGNVITLARELGLLAGNPKMQWFLRGVTKRRRQRAETEKFDAWRNRSIRELSARYRYLSRKAALAGEVLRFKPDCEAAWDALARWHHAKARVSATLDYLSFTKASRWLEADSTREQVMEIWRQCATRAA